uniref:Peptidase S1 domain-containing protein n=1 Tax=Ciona savignyi TaxID=51511 RepID=H2ZII5_CIOSA
CSTNNGECEHLCNIHNNAIQCSCHPGYELISNGKNCTDIDECASQNRVCPEPSRPFCVNLKGSFQCSNQSCRAVNGQSNRYQSGTCCQHEIGDVSSKIILSFITNSVPDERIVGGKSSFLGGWPWMVYILIDGSTLCGGTLIDEYWVVTAAHCFKTATSSTTVKMYFGRLNPYATREQEPHVQIRDAVQLILHEEWDKNRFPYNDIALLRVGTAVRFNQFTNKVCLPNGESPSPGTRCWVTGFGTTAYRGPAAKILREVSLPIVDLNTCARSYTSTSYPIDQQKMLCAGYAQGGRDACQGDSGGPLVCQRCDSCSWYLAGVVSYGKGCATPTYYGVYTNVEKYEQWIRCHGSPSQTGSCNTDSCSGQFGPCSGLVNTLRPLTTTSNCYSKISWCSTFVQYMGGACARACCENRNGLQITLTVCQDTPTYSDYCQGQQQYCQQSSLATIASPEYVSFVYLNCGKSCGFC